MWIVHGGEHTDTTFTKVVSGTEESYGPFETLEEAEQAWHAGTFTQKLDICTHRLHILPYVEPSNDPKDLAQEGVVHRVHMMESERGWGMDHWHVDFDTRNKAEDYYAVVNAKNTSPRVPDCYTKATKIETIYK